MELIRHAESHPGMSVRVLGELFECWKIQVGHILKKKELLSMYESNVSSSRVHTNTHRPSEFAEVHKALHEWVYDCMFQELLSWGPQLIEKAKEIAWEA